MIQTVTGPVESSELGITLPHEHLLLVPPASYVEKAPAEFADLAESQITLQNYRRLLRTVFYNRDALTLNDEGIASEELLMFKRAGGATLVDMTVEGLGRNAEALRRISIASSVKVVMGTGFFIESSHPSRVKSASVDFLADEMIRDISEGVGQTGIRAGVIGELGITRGEITDQEEKVLRAAAIANRKTRRAINVHTWGDPPAKRTQNRVLDILEEEGTSLENVALSHVEQIKTTGTIPRTDWEYVGSLAARGCYVMLDAFGQDWPWGVSWAFETKNVTYIPSPTDFDRVQSVTRLLDMGYGKKILMSHDVWHKLRLKRYGGEGYDHLITNVLKLFRFLGLTEDIIRQLMVENPANYLK